MDQLPIITLTELVGNKPPQLNTLQTSMEPYVSILTWGWFLLWTVTACIVLGILVRAYVRHRSRDTQNR